MPYPSTRCLSSLVERLAMSIQIVPFLYSCPKMLYIIRSTDWSGLGVRSRPLSHQLPLEFRPLVRCQRRGGLAHLDGRNQQQCHTCQSSTRPEADPVLLTEADILFASVHHRGADGQLANAKPEGHTQVEQTVDHPTGGRLQLGGHGRGDVDVCDVEGDVHSDRSAEHGREDVGPVEEIDARLADVLVARGDDGEEQDREKETCLRNDHEDTVGEDVHEKTTADGEEHAAHSQGCEPSCCEQRFDSQGDFDAVIQSVDVRGCRPLIHSLEAGVEEEETEHAVGAEHGEREPLHVLWPKDFGRQQRLLRNPALNIDGCDEQKTTDDQGDIYVRGVPSVWRMSTIGKGEDDQDETRHDGDEAPPVHLDERIGVAQVPRDIKPPRYNNDKAQDGPDPEVPPPVQQIRGNSTQQDADVEANAGKGTVEAEDKVLPRAGPVGPRQQRKASRHEGTGPETLHSSTDNQHGGVDAEAADQRPNQKPGMADEEDYATPVSVSHPGEGH